MWTIPRIAVGLGLTVVTLFSGSVFWQMRKRARFLRRVIVDESFLGQFICRRALEDANASPSIAPFAEKNPVGYFLNIKAVMDADDISQRRVRVASTAFLVAILGASWLLGVSYLIVNISAFLVTAAVPIAESARSNALQQVLAIALIFHKWRQESTAECEHWIEQASSLRPLYNVVKRAE